MTTKKTILAIVGSASSNSANHKLLEHISNLISEDFSFKIFNDLKALPHFDPELSAENPPQQIIEFRKSIEQADGIIICTPEYIFSIPSGLKNSIEWCISTTIFSDKPTGLITASASGHKGHEQLQLIMKTAMAKFTEDTCLLIPGIKGKFDEHGNFTDTEKRLEKFTNTLIQLIKEK